MPPDHEVSNLVSLSAEKHRIRLESAKVIPDVEDAPGKKGTELSKTQVDLRNGDWCLKVVPWIGGRIISMEHLPTGTLLMNLRRQKLCELLRGSMFCEGAQGSTKEMVHIVCLMFYPWFVTGRCRILVCCRRN